MKERKAMKVKANQSNRILTSSFIRLFLVSSILAFSTQFQATTFPLYVQTLGGKLAVAGLMTSVYMGASALCKPFIGKILHDHPRKRMLIIGGIIFSMFLFSYRYIQIIPLLLLVRACSAPFYSACSTAATTMTTDLLPEDRLLEGLGYYNLSQTLATALGPSIALFLIEYYSYPTLFLAGAILALVAILVGSTVKYDEPVLRRRVESTVAEKPNETAQESCQENSGEHSKAKGKLSLRDMAEGIINPGTGIPALMLLMIMLGTSGIVTYLPTWAKTVHVENIGIFFTVQAIALALSRAFVGCITKKVGISATVAASTILITICLLGITFTRSIWVLLVLAFIYGIGLGAVVPSLHTIAILHTSKDNRGMANSIIQMANEVGICISSVTLGLIADAIGIQNIFLFACVFMAMAMAVYFVGLRPQIKKLKI